jgi:hypothetical protein
MIKDVTPVEGRLVTRNLSGKEAAWGQRRN